MMSFFDSIRKALPVHEPVLVFGLALWVILLAPLVVRRLRLPDIIGMILAGVALGDHGLNILARDETMVLLSTVGLLYIMFLAGLEIDLNQFMRRRSPSLPFGVLTFLVPQIGGTLVGIWLFDFSWPAALLLASLFASHTLVAYPTATRLGIAKNPAVTATVGGTIITDTLALLVLVVVVALSEGNLSWIFWAKFSLSMLVYGFFIAWGVPRLARWYFHQQGDHGSRDFVFILAIAFLSAYLAELAGAETIIGAFFAGLALNRFVPEQSPLMNRIQFVGHTLLIPFFLIGIGMLADLRMIFSTWHVWWVGGSMIVTVLATKWLAAWISQRMLGFSKDEGGVMFALSVPHAAVTLAAVFVGHRIELFNDEILNGTILMILVTCILGPWLVDRYGRRVALHEELAPLKAGETPLRILLPLANPSSAPALMDLAFSIRRSNSTEPVYPITVVTQQGDVTQQVANSERMLSHAVIYASGAGIPVQPVTRVDPNIATGLNRAISELRISTVVIGWTGDPSKRRFALGTVLDQLLHENPQSVIVCRLLLPLNTTRRIILLLPPFVEREKGFGEALRTVHLMASHQDAKLLVVAAGREIKHLEPRMKRIRPAVPTEFQGLSSRALFGGEIGVEKIEKDDLVILMNTREGRLAWSPELSQLPLRLVRRYPSNNVILFYPPEQESEQAIYSGAILLLEPERTVLGIPAMSFEEALDYIIAPHFREKPVAKTIRDLLETNAREYSTEIAKGTILIHSHVPSLSRPWLFFATSKEGLTVPNIDHPVHVMLLLLSPPAWPAEDHLRTLANLARMMHDPDLADRLADVTTFDELREQLDT